MKLLGIQSIDGGIAIAMPSGRQILVALPADPQRAAAVLGERVLELLHDPDEPHAQQGGTSDVSEDDDEREDDALAALGAGIEAGRLVWRTLQLVSRGRGR
ncbi:MAG: hypothetical protein KC501_21680 [Myxococcales bacterium]|nr:hypothetical protein [Myxococcales bacterium]